MSIHDHSYYSLSPAPEVPSRVFLCPRGSWAIFTHITIKSDKQCHEARKANRLYIGKNRVSGKR